MTPLDVIRSARDLIRSRDYCTGHYALAASRQPVGSCSSNATCFCIAGAIDRISEHEASVFQPAWDLLRQAAGEASSKDLVKRFDTWTKAQALAFLGKVLGEAVEAPKRGRISKETLAAQLLKE